MYARGQLYLGAMPANHPIYPFYLDQYTCNNLIFVRAKTQNMGLILPLQYNFLTIGETINETRYCIPNERN